MPELARIERLDLPQGRRVLAVSDIHGNLPYFEGLLAEAGFSEEDELILVGDLLEKGRESLGLLRRVMALCARGNTHALLGNCDGWHRIFSAEARPEHNAQILSYVRYRRSGLLWDMLQELGIDPMRLSDFGEVKNLLWETFWREWAFLSALPDALESERFVFAHAGMSPDKPLREHTAAELNRIDRFLDRDMRFARWLIVGHYPVVLYGKDIVCANPLVCPDKRVVSIDGGCVLKDDGQLNALVLPETEEEDFSFFAYDPFPERTVLADQTASERSCYIRWGDNRVQVLKRGEEFSRCRHLRTGYEMDILTRYLFTDGEVTAVNDCTDYVLPLKAGDRVRVVEETGRGFFVKHRGVSGWYYGPLGD